MRLINHDQGSQEWLNWRTTGVGGSDAPVVMGVSPYDTYLGLWALKLGRRAPIPDNPGMQRGRMLEEPARRAYERETGIFVTPACAEHDRYPFIKASFDGLALLQDIGVEIKCPSEEDHALALRGVVPGKYYPQCQHLMLVTGYDQWHYWSFDGREGVLVEVKRDDTYIGRMMDRETKFWDDVRLDRMPIEDEIILAASEWRHASGGVSQAEENLAWAKERLLLAAGHSLSEVGSIDTGLATIITSENPGVVDWKALAADLGISQDVIEKYRKASTGNRVSVRAASVAKTELVHSEVKKRRISLPATPRAATSDFDLCW